MNLSEKEKIYMLKSDSSPLMKLMKSLKQPKGKIPEWINDELVPISGNWVEIWIKPMRS